MNLMSHMREEEEAECKEEDEGEGKTNKLSIF